MDMKPAKKAPMPASSWMEPMLPSDGSKALEDIAFDLISNANALAGQIHPIVTESVGNLVRSMNCYYSNLIEGHDTHPRDIDRALHKDYSTEPRKRALQLEAVAHIEVQKAIDEGDDPKDFPASSAYAIWLHREFCRRLPDELLWVEDPETKRRIRLTPGALRDGEVVVGLHLPPPAAALPGFLQAFRAGLQPTEFIQGATGDRRSGCTSSLPLDSSFLRRQRSRGAIDVARSVASPRRWQ